MKLNMGFCIQAMEYISSALLMEYFILKGPLFNTESIAAPDVEPKQME